MSLALAVFARPPVPGATKTRLIPALGPAGACEMYAAFLDDVLSLAARFRDVATGVQVHLYAAAPDEGGALRRRADSLGMPLHQQRGADLGERMRRALQDGIDACGAAMIIGTDSPSMPLGLLQAAARALELPQPAHPAHPSSQPNGPVYCVGPAADGGYVLIGARHQVPSFSHVRFGTRHALADTLAANPDHRFRQTPPWYDVDTPADLRLLALHLRLAPEAAPRSAALVSNLGLRPQTC